MRQKSVQPRTEIGTPSEFRNVAWLVVSYPFILIFLLKIYMIFDLFLHHLHKKVTEVKKTFYINERLLLLSSTNRHMRCETALAPSDECYWKLVLILLLLLLLLPSANLCHITTGDNYWEQWLQQTDPEDVKHKQSCVFMEKRMEMPTIVDELQIHSNRLLFH